MIGAIEKGALAVAAVDMISTEIGSIGEERGSPTADAAIKAISNILDAYYRGLRPPRGDA